MFLSFFSLNRILYNIEYYYYFNYSYLIFNSKHSQTQIIIIDNLFAIPVNRPQRRTAIQERSVHLRPANNARGEGQAAQCHRRPRGCRPRTTVRFKRSYLAALLLLTTLLSLIIHNIMNLVYLYRNIRLILFLFKKLCFISLLPAASSALSGLVKSISCPNPNRGPSVLDYLGWIFPLPFGACVFVTNGAIVKQKVFKMIIKKL